MLQLFTDPEKRGEVKEALTNKPIQEVAKALGVFKATIWCFLIKTGMQWPAQQHQTA